MDSAGRAQLVARLRECGEQELIELLQAELDNIDPETVRTVLLNPYVSTRVIELILGERRLLSSHEVQRALALHSQTPEPRALNLVPALYWRDLVELGSNARVRPRVRLAADRRLAERLPKLGIGERVAIARKAGPGVISRLLRDPHLRVIGALLENPRMTEGLLAPLLHSDEARPEVLARIAGDRKWGRRYSVRVAIARNPRAHADTALKLLVYLNKPDLRDLRKDTRLAAAVRRRAGLLLGIDPAESPI
ncbi:MAG: hypothetical protein ACE5GX_01410 [Thermoanaerobaculia bacterium]